MGVDTEIHQCGQSAALLLGISGRPHYGIYIFVCPYQVPNTMQKIKDSDHVPGLEEFLVPMRDTDMRGK